MYKTSVITDEISQDLPFAARVAREYGLQGLEISGGHGEDQFIVFAAVEDEFPDILAR